LAQSSEEGTQSRQAESLWRLLRLMTRVARSLGRRRLARRPSHVAPAPQIAFYLTYIATDGFVCCVSRLLLPCILVGIAAQRQASSRLRSSALLADALSPSLWRPGRSWSALQRKRRRTHLRGAPGHSSPAMGRFASGGVQGGLPGTSACVQRRRRWQSQSACGEWCCGSGALE